MVLRLKTIIFFIGVIIVSVCLLMITGLGRTIYEFLVPSGQVIAQQIDRLEQENNALRDILNAILPVEKEHMIYPNPYRSDEAYRAVFNTQTIGEIIANGENIPFEMLYHDQEYIRPIYDPEWKTFYFRNWLYLPTKLEQARHQLFILYGGVSNLFDMMGHLGLQFEKQDISIDYHKNIHFLVYNFDVKQVKMKHHQIVLLGEPVRKGLQVIAVDVAAILADKDYDQFLFQLATPGGYEIDYFYGVYQKSEYYKQRYELLAKPAFIFAEDATRLQQLKDQNNSLKRQLSSYIPLENETKMFSDISKYTDVTIEDIQNVYQESYPIKWQVEYANSYYQRPLYHPIWAHNEDIRFIPDLIAINLRTLFLIPNIKQQEDFFNKHGFGYQIHALPEDKTCLLIYDFLVREVVQYHQHILLIGEPTRKGVGIISLDIENVNNNAQYHYHLVTPDLFEIDYLGA